MIIKHVIDNIVEFINTIKYENKILFFIELFIPRANYKHIENDSINNLIYFIFYQICKPEHNVIKYEKANH